MVLVVMSLPDVLSVMNCSWGVFPRLAYASVSIMEKHDPNTSRNRPEVSILRAFVGNRS
jgi:hypothetical protein